MKRVSVYSQKCFQLLNVMSNSLKKIYFFAVLLELTHESSYVFNSRMMSCFLNGRRLSSVWKDRKSLRIQELSRNFKHFLVFPIHKQSNCYPIMFRPLNCSYCSWWTLLLSTKFFSKLFSYIITKNDTKPLIYLFVETHFIT